MKRYLIRRKTTLRSDSAAETSVSDLQSAADESTNNDSFEKTEDIDCGDVEEVLRRRERRRQWRRQRLEKMTPEERAEFRRNETARVQKYKASLTGGRARPKIERAVIETSFDLQKQRERRREWRRKKLQNMTPEEREEYRRKETERVKRYRTKSQMTDSEQMEQPDKPLNAAQQSHHCDLEKSCEETFKRIIENKMRSALSMGQFSTNEEIVLGYKSVNSGNSDHQQSGDVDSGSFSHLDSEPASSGSNVKENKGKRKRGRKSRKQKQDFITELSLDRHTNSFLHPSNFGGKTSFLSFHSNSAKSPGSCSFDSEKSNQDVEDVEQRREKRRQWRRKRLEKMTEEERAEFRRKESARVQKYKLSQGTKQEKVVLDDYFDAGKRCERRREWRRKRLQNMTPEERAEYRRKETERVKKYRIGCSWTSSESNESSAKSSEKKKENMNKCSDVREKQIHKERKTIAVEEDASEDKHSSSCLLPSNSDDQASSSNFQNNSVTMNSDEICDLHEDQNQNIEETPLDEDIQEKDSIQPNAQEEIDDFSNVEKCNNVHEKQIHKPDYETSCAEGHSEAAVNEEVCTPSPYNDNGGADILEMTKSSIQITEMESLVPGDDEGDIAERKTHLGEELIANVHEKPTQKEMLVENEGTELAHKGRSSSLTSKDDKEKEDEGEGLLGGVENYYKSTKPCKNLKDRNPEELMQHRKALNTTRLRRHRALNKARMDMYRTLINDDFIPTLLNTSHSSIFGPNAGTENGGSCEKHTERDFA